MVALATDKLLKVGNPGSATTLSSPGYTIGATSITVGSTSNWPTDTGVVFAIDEAEVVNGVEVQVAGTYNEYVGTVASGTSITNVDWALGSGDRNYASGALTRVYIPVSAERENRIVEWGLVHADQDGTLKDGAVSTAKLVDGAVTQAKLSTTAGEIGGAWASWTPTLTNITLGNGTVVAKYSQIGKTVRYKLSFTMGTTSAMGSVPKFTLPVTAAAIAGASNGIVIGRGSIWDFGTNNFDAVVVYETTTLAAIRVLNATFSNVVQTGINSTNPMTWASTDEIHVSGEYEAA